MKLKTLHLNLPFDLGGIELAPNNAEREAAWALYVELTTRVATQHYDRTTGSLRGVLSSLYTIFEFTRQVLREAGPDVAHDAKSFGPLAIEILTKGIAPFTTKWHQTLQAHEISRPDGVSVTEHEQSWDKYGDMCAELDTLQNEMRIYTEALLEIAGANISAND